MTTTQATRETLAPSVAPAGRRGSASSLATRCAGPVLVAVLSMLAVVQALQLWKWRPGLPLSLAGDSPQLLTQLTAVLEGARYQSSGHVGAPFGLNGSWFATADQLNFAILRTIGLFTNTTATAAVILFVAGFPAAALSAYWLARQLGIHRPAAVMVGTLFAVLPGHQTWFTHLWIATYWVMPLGVWLALRTLQGQPLWPPLHELTSAGPKRRPAALLAARTVLMALAIGLSDVYYVAFTLVLLAVALMVRMARTRRVVPLLPGIASALLVALPCALSLALTVRGRAGDLVTSDLPAQRTIGEAERYSGKLIDLVLPWNEHRFEPFAFLTTAYGYAAPPSVEHPALGFVALAGVTGLLWVTLRNLAGGHRVPATLGSLTVLLLVAIAFYTKGGLGSVVALFFTPQIRTWSRLVVVIGLFGLLAVGMWASRPGRSRRAAWPLAAGLILLGVLDQTNPGVAPDYQALRATQQDLIRFTATVRQSTGPGCAVFQLPVTRYPEEPPPGSMGDYDHFLPSLASPPDLAWSYGAMRGTARADWQLALPVADTPRLLDDLAAAGFCAVEVNRSGYANGTDPTADLAKALGPAVAQTRDGDLAAYSLAARREAIDALPAGQRPAERDDVLRPTLVTLGGSLVDLDPDGVPRQWTGSSADLRVANMGAASRTLQISFDVTALDGRPGELKVAGPVQGTTSFALTGAATHVVLDVTAAPGLTTLALTSRCHGDDHPRRGRRRRGPPVRQHHRRERHRHRQRVLGAAVRRRLAAVRPIAGAGELVTARQDRDRSAPERPAEGPAPSGLVRWAPVALLGLLLLALTRSAGAGISDPDTLWHVLAGDHLRATWQFAGPDPLSQFTTEPWVLTQWLPELGLSLAHGWGGLPAVALLADLGRLAVCIAVYVGCRREAGPLPAALVTAVTVLGSAASLSPRPQLVGFALLAVTTTAWLATARDLRVRWWLVPLAWVWASSHGTWVVGIMLGAAVSVGLVADRRVDLRSGRAAARGPGPLRGGRPGHAARAPAARDVRHGAGGQPLHPGVAPAGARRARHARPARPGAARRRDVVLPARAGQLDLRRGPAGRPGVGPQLCPQRGHRGDHPRSPGCPRARPRAGAAPTCRGPEPAVVAVLVAVSVAVGAVAAWSGPRAPVGVPTGMSAALRSLPDGSVVYNDDLLGGWLLWSFPELRPTRDTRAELFGPESARAYLRDLQAQDGWQASVERDHPSAALIGADTPLATALADESGWTVVRRERGYVLLEPPRG